ASGGFSFNPFRIGTFRILEACFSSSLSCSRSSTSWSTSSTSPLIPVFARTRFRAHIRACLTRHFRDRLGVVAAAVTLGIVVLGSAAPWIAPYAPYVQDLRARLQPPSRSHWIGTDEVGRDILSRVLYGVRVSYGIAVVSAVLTPLVAVPVGLIAGYY